MSLTLLLLLSSPTLHAAECDFDAAKTVLARTARGYTAAWTIPDAPSLREPVPLAGAQGAFAAWVRARTSLDARGILANHVAVGEKLARDLRPDDPFVAEIRKGNALVRKVIDGGIGRIRPVNCLESIPFREFLKVVDLRGDAKEMGVLVFRKDGQLRLVADLYADGAEGGVQESDASRRERRSLERAGWELVAHLHNHPFDFTNPYGDIGGETMPSQPDVETYLALRPREGLVTNGIDTIELRPSEYPLLNLPR